MASGYQQSKNARNLHSIAFLIILVMLVVACSEVEGFFPEGGEERKKVFKTSWLATDSRNHRKFGKYKLGGEVLAYGGQGYVIPVSHEDKKYVIKVPLHEHMNRLAKKEFQLMEKFKGIDYVIEPVESFEDQRHFIIVMERFWGSLFDLANEVTESTTLENFKTVVLQGLQGILNMALHDVYHRDLKPGNIFVSLAEYKIEKITLGDLGHAKIGPDKNGFDFVGTRCFWPPLNFPPAAPWMRDVYALIVSALMFYPGIYNRKCFVKTRGNVAEWWPYIRANHHQDYLKIVRMRLSRGPLNQISDQILMFLNRPGLIEFMNLLEKMKIFMGITSTQKMPSGGDSLAQLGEIIHQFRFMGSFQLAPHLNGLVKLESKEDRRGLWRFHRFSVPGTEKEEQEMLWSKLKNFIDSVEANKIEAQLVDAQAKIGSVQNFLKHFDDTNLHAISEAMERLTDAQEKIGIYSKFATLVPKNLEHYRRQRIKYARLLRDQKEKYEISTNKYYETNKTLREALDLFGKAMSPVHKSFKEVLASINEKQRSKHEVIKRIMKEWRTQIMFFREKSSYDLCVMKIAQKKMGTIGSLLNLDLSSVLYRS